jgi:hypothetical protein
MLDRSILVYTSSPLCRPHRSTPRFGHRQPRGALDRYGNKVALANVKYDNWAGDSAALQRAIEEISLPTVIDVFDVVKEGEGGAPIIDITSLFTTNVPEASRSISCGTIAWRGGWPALPHPQRRAFPSNVEIGYYQTWVPDEKTCQAIRR